MDNNVELKREEEIGEYLMNIKKAFFVVLGG